MIVGTHFGLFMPALRPNWRECVENGEPELQVRSRRKVDLLNLRALMREHALFLGEPFAIKNTDYQWRAYCTREDWGRALVIIADDIDYTKFKDTPAMKHGDTKLTAAYSAIWGATLHAFPTGSVYSSPSRGARQTGRSSQTNRGASQTFSVFDEPRVAETVYRTENREWRMSGASATDMAALMREIDAATAGVELPSEDELREVDRYIVNIDAPYMGVGPTEINGHLDHSKCAHNTTANARRKCRKRFYRS